MELLAGNTARTRPTRKDRAMGHYKSNVRDIEFNLFEVLGREELLGQGPYEEIDADTAREMVREVARLAEHELAESLLDSDRTPPVYDPKTYEVTVPASVPQELPGLPGRRVVAHRHPRRARRHRDPAVAALGDRRASCSAPTRPCTCTRPASPSPRCCTRWAPTSRSASPSTWSTSHWGATMVLTEPDAGSDVGAGRTKAVQQPDGTWHITGVKRFITSAEADFYDNVVHFVLARPEGAGAGTKGLSLFIVPKYHVDLETGEKGERNGAFVTNVEHKMGLKVSTTCEVRFGEVDGIPAVGTLLGEVHDGIAQMFKIIEFARMMVGTKAIATLSTGYLNALDYAKERVQGADLTQMTDKAAPRVTITHHPDVRRSLMLQKAYAEGLRALVLYTASQQDTVDVAGHAAGGGEAVRGRLGGDMAVRVNDLLLPLVKGCGSERAWVLLGTESLQTFGGSGFLQDYPDRAVRPRLEDRQPVRGHDGDPGHGLLLPQDRAGQGPGARPPRDPDPGVREGRRRRPRPPSASCWARRSRTCRASSARWSPR